MKILMTGANARSIGSTKIRYDYVQFHQIMKAGLEALGHEVDMKPVFSTDDLDDCCYDRALVHVGAPSSLSNGYLPGAALTLARFGEKARVYVDDWSAERLADDIAAHIERPRGWERHVSVFRPKEWGRLGHVRHVNAARKALLSFLDPQGPPWVIAGPFFNWGDPRGFFTTGKRIIHSIPFTIDPSPMISFPSFARPADARRARRWVLATLQNHERWLQDLNMTWELSELGAAKKNVGGVRRSDAPAVLPEAEVVRHYASAWGVLSPWYKTAGSGWWRARFNYAAEVGAILFCGDADGEWIGPSFTNTVSEIEAATTSELRALADRQAQQLWEHAATTDEFLERMDELVA